MQKMASKKDSASTSYDFALDASRPRDLGIGAQRSGESARTLAMSLGTGDAGKKGLVTGAIATGILGVPSYKALTKKGRKSAKKSLKQDTLMLKKFIKNISTPEAIGGLADIAKEYRGKKISFVKNRSKKSLGELLRETKSKPLKEALDSLQQLKKKRGLRNIGLGALSGVGMHMGLSSLENLIAYETGRGLSPKAFKVKQPKQVK